MAAVEGRTDPLAGSLVNRAHAGQYKGLKAGLMQGRRLFAARRVRAREAQQFARVVIAFCQTLKARLAIYAKARMLVGARWDRRETGGRPAGHWRDTAGGNASNNRHKSKHSLTCWTA